MADRAPLSPPSLHHVSLLVSDLERSLAFWCGVIGLAPDPNRPALGFDGAWLQLADGLSLHLLRLPSPDPQAGRPTHAGRDRHLALQVNSISDYRQRLEAWGAAITTSRSGRDAIFCRDPDGNGVELIASS